MQIKHYFKRKNGVEVFRLFIGQIVPRAPTLKSDVLQWRTTVLHLCTEGRLSLKKILDDKQIICCTKEITPSWLSKNKKWIIEEFGCNNQVSTDSNDVQINNEGTVGCDQVDTLPNVAHMDVTNEGEADEDIHDIDEV